MIRPVSPLICTVAQHDGMTLTSADHTLARNASLSREAFHRTRLQLPDLPSSSAGLEAELQHAYATRVVFTIRKDWSTRNLALEAGLDLMGEEAVEALVRCVEIEIGSRLTVKLALRGHVG